MHSHPLVEIHFWQMSPEGEVERKVVNWYHVPRVGDLVELGFYDTTLDINAPHPGYMDGVVEIVHWEEIKGIVSIRLR